MLKAILSKNKVSIYEPKKRNQPYKTLSLGKSMEASKLFLPTDISCSAVFANIKTLVEYRDNAIHFYNEKAFEVVIYGLAQTSIVNFKDIVLDIFALDITKEISINLLPLSFAAPPDPIKFIGSSSVQSNKPAIVDYLKIISDATRGLESENADTGRFLTVFQVNLQSTKKIQSADLIAGVKSENPSGYVLVTKRVDPNYSHPKSKKDFVELLKIKNSTFNSFTFDALVWEYGIKNDDSYSWKNNKTGTYQYSESLIAFINSLTNEIIKLCVEKYKFNKSRD